jgi:hypothetical protein
MMRITEKEAYRERALLEVFDRVEAKVAEARARGVDRPTALVVEKGDRLARAMVRSPGEAARLDADAARVRRLGLRPVLLTAGPWATVRALLARRSPEWTPIPPSTYPPEGYLAVVVARGGVTVFAMPPDAVGPGPAATSAPAGPIP